MCATWPSRVLKLAMSSMRWAGWTGLDECVVKRCHALVW